MVKQQQVGRRAYVKYTNDSSLSVTESNTTNYTILGMAPPHTPSLNDNNYNEGETVTNDRLSLLLMCQESTVKSQIGF